MSKHESLPDNKKLQGAQSTLSHSTIATDVSDGGCSVCLVPRMRKIQNSAFSQPTKGMLNE